MIKMKNNRSSGSRKFLYTSVFIGNLAAFAIGISLGWTSPVNSILKNESKIDQNPLGTIISDNQDSWISSLLPLGGAFGPIVAGFLADRLGQKYTLIFITGIPLLVSFIILAFARHIFLYYLARFVAGIAFGNLLAVLPNFNSEIAEDSIRGMISSSINVFLLSGPVYSYAIGPYISIKWFSLTCAVWPAVFIVLFFLFVPESPYYLVAIDDSRGAMESLTKFRPNADSDTLENIKLYVEESMQKKRSFFDIFKSQGLKKAFIISIGLMAIQQFSGITVLLFNIQTIFDATGSSLSSEISSTIIGVVQVGASFITPALVDKAGRKLILTVSAVGMFISEAPLGIYFYLHEQEKDVSSISWLPITCLIIYIIFYNFGFGILPWTVMAELFPTDVKSSASMVIACFVSLLSFLLTNTFGSLRNAIGLSGSFWFFSGFCGISIPFLMFYMLETKGKSFQEIQEILSK